MLKNVKNMARSDKKVADPCFRLFQKQGLCRIRRIRRMRIRILGPEAERNHEYESEKFRTRSFTSYNIFFKILTTFFSKKFKFWRLLQNVVCIGMLPFKFFYWQKYKFWW